jgi:hypothetical protein
MGSRGGDHTGSFRPASATGSATRRVLFDSIACCLALSSPLCEASLGDDVHDQDDAADREEERDDQRDAVNAVWTEVKDRIELKRTPCDRDGDEDDSPDNSSDEREPGGLARTGWLRRHRGALTPHSGRVGSALRTQQSVGCERRSAARTEEASDGHGGS